MNAVTGALSYTGRAIAEELLARGEAVRSLSRRDDPSDPLRAHIELAPLRFDNSLGEALRGVTTLYNTYWIRFERGGHTFDEAVARTILLFRAAERAGVERIVHVSVSNADRAPGLPYFCGKARIDRWLVESGIRHAIVRPTLVFRPRGHPGEQHRVDHAACTGVRHTARRGARAARLGARRRAHLRGLARRHRRCGGTGDAHVRRVAAPRPRGSRGAHARSSTRPVRSGSRSLAWPGWGCATSC